MLFRLGKKHTNKQNNKTENKKANLIFPIVKLRNFIPKLQHPRE